jgi:hypothetical protein
MVIYRSLAKSVVTYVVAQPSGRLDGWDRSDGCRRRQFSMNYPAEPNNVTCEH